ncbi:hypothetical protein HOE425_332327 [Hoeflea sp. EC-HK425]|nr:hypothetical protein HOE425_332327 [Hoeflea sp. EC-HK425]
MCHRSVGRVIHIPIAVVPGGCDRGSGAGRALLGIATHMALDILARDIGAVGSPGYIGKIDAQSPGQGNDRGAGYDIGPTHLTIPPKYTGFP